MLTSIKMEAKETITINEEVLEEIKNIWSDALDHKISPINFNLYISKKTYDECHDTLVDIFGSNLEDIAVIASDKKIKFGLVYFEYYNSYDIRMDDNEWQKYKCLFMKNKVYDASELKNIISLESPGFLIMNNPTWTILADTDMDNIDSFDNEIGYYHSYCKIPVALSSFPTVGEIFIAK